MSPQDPRQPTVGFLILADRAEAVNGKLYMMGGGWDRLYVPEFAQPQSISMGLGIVVPWNATNVRHSLSIRVEGEDGNELAKIGLKFNTGRPPTLGPAESQRIVLAFQLQLPLPRPGTYVVKAYINDVEASKVIFYAELLPGSTAAMPPSA